MQRPKIRNPGWAAFDRKHREKEGNGPEGNVNPFPSLSDLSSSLAVKNLMANSFEAIKPFSSVVHPPLDVPPFGTSCMIGTVNNNSSKNQVDCQAIVDANRTSAMKLLKDVHCWADQQLIEDVLSAVNGDVDQASVHLKAMVSPDSEIEDASVMVSPDTKIEEASLSNQKSSIEKDQCGEKNNYIQRDTSVENKLSDSAHEVLISTRLLYVPAAPEWEEDDVYLSHRKDAMKMMRAASQHSRAASNAFMRGDHYSAHQLSMRAQEEWIAAEKLNNKAADEILRIRNNNNDLLKIDLHGLHASEAVRALKKHLHIIESEIMMNRNASSEGLSKLEAGIEHSPSSETVKDFQTDSKARKALSQQRQKILQVITGTGNHSRGQASLPSAVKSFLIENGYRFDEARPGVVAVRPKFRNK